MTKKLYYDDAYIKSFDASVISCAEAEGGFEVVLDKTAFFPEEGGQSSDKGEIGGIRVLDVFEREGVIYHLLSSAPESKDVFCTLDFDERFDKMQQHTAEHILCGIIHSLWGYDNVGFHLGEDEVTFDINAVLTREQLDFVEEKANEAVFKNLKVKAEFPGAKSLKTLEYRSKIEADDSVRIVTVGDVDACACCAPHVSMTGEIGLIKIFDFMKHRGGTRIWMAAGKRALFDYRIKYENILKISALLSAPQHETAEALVKLTKDTEALKNGLKHTREALAKAEASSLPSCEGNSFTILEDYSFDELRAFANEYKKRVGGITVALSGAEGEYKYILASDAVDLTKVIKEINTALSGRGGGKPGMVQGTFLSTAEKIKAYFE